MKKLSNKAVVTISVLLVLLGLALIFNNYFEEKKDLAYEKINISLYSTSANGQIINNTPTMLTKEEGDELVEAAGGEQAISDANKNKGYLGVLKIDKINLEQGFYDKGDSRNNVDKNVTILDASDYPDTPNGNVILAAHSGSSYLGYFKHLYQLSKGDLASITYKGKTYVYKITNIYNDTKDGTVTVYRNKNKSTLTLITCTKDDNYHQTLYIAELQ